MNTVFKYISNVSVLRYVLVSLVSWYIKCVARTTRWNVIIDGDFPDTPRCITACWHNRILMGQRMWKATPYAKHTPLNFIVSPSRDGKMLQRFLQLLGHNAFVGSSGSGTSMAPFKNAIKILNNNTPFCIAPDGSRGPRYHMKDGISFLAIKQNVPVILSSYNTKSRTVLNSWDKMICPHPFGRGVIMIKIVDVSHMEIQHASAFLEQELTTLTQKTDSYFHHTPIGKA